MDGCALLLGPTGYKLRLQVVGGASASRRLSGHKTCMPPSGFGDARLQVHRVLIVDIPTDTFPLYLKTLSVRLNYEPPFL